MLHILLLLIKIIGWILLAALAVIILLLLIVLFVPIRYQAKLSRSESEGEPPLRVQGSVFWLLHLLNIRFRYDGSPTVRARITLYPIFTIPASAKRKNRHKKKQKKALEEAAVAEETATEAISGATDKASEKDRTPEAERSAEPREDSLAEKIPDEIPDEIPDADHTADTEEKLSAHRPDLKKLLRLFHNVKKCVANIQYTITSLCDKIKNILHNIQYYKDILEGETFRQALALCRNELGGLLRHMKPRKFEADWIIGTGDPLLNSELQAVYGIFFPAVGRQLRIVFDYDACHIEGELFIKGHIRTITLIRAAVKLYFNKDIKKLIHQMKKEAA